MESAKYFYQLNEQLAAPQSTHGVAAAATIHEWNPSLHPNNDEYNHYMNEILPNSTELPSKNANFPDMGYDEYESSCANTSTNSIKINAVDLNENLWLGASFSCNDQISRQQLLAKEQYSPKESWVAGRFSSCPAVSSSNDNYVFNNNISSSGLVLMSNSSPDSTQQDLNLATDMMSYLSNINDPSYSPPSSSSNKISTSRNEAINPGTKRSVSSTNSSQRRPSHEAAGAAKKPRAASQSSSPLPKAGKEKIGDRIATLQKLVAPFGKTDTASVLTEAIGYIQFLQHQIQTLSMPCRKQSHSDAHSWFQGVLSKSQDQINELEAKQDLASRGLCLVPLSFASYISSSFTGLGGI